MNRATPNPAPELTPNRGIGQWVLENGLHLQTANG